MTGRHRLMRSVRKACSEQVRKKLGLAMRHDAGSLLECVEQVEIDIRTEIATHIE